MIEIVNGLEMSLAKKNFDDWLVSIKQQDSNFSRIEKQGLNHSKQMNVFLITRGSSIFSINSDNNILAERFSQYQLENHFEKKLLTWG